MGDELLHRVQLLIDGGASLFVAGLGVPIDAVDLCHRNGVLVANMCGKVSHAERAVASGCDLVVAQGTEAGGHTGQVATMPLVPQIVDAVGDKVPVVAAGGIFDGRGLAAALALGADGVWVGTRFIATPEARSVAGYKEALLAAGEDSDAHHEGVLRQTDAGAAQRLHEPLRRTPRRDRTVPRSTAPIDGLGRLASRRATSGPPTSIRRRKASRPVRASEESTGSSRPPS